MELVRGLTSFPDVDLAHPFRDDGGWAAHFEAKSPVYHADFESVHPGSLSSETYSGLDGMRALWLDWLAPWANYRGGIEKCIDLGERVLTLIRAFGPFWERSGGREQFRRCVCHPRREDRGSSTT